MNYSNSTNKSKARVEPKEEAVNIVEKITVPYDTVFVAYPFGKYWCSKEYTELLFTRSTPGVVLLKKKGVLFLN